MIKNEKVITLTISSKTDMMFPKRLERQNAYKNILHYSYSNWLQIKAVPSKTSNLGYVTYHLRNTSPSSSKKPWITNITKSNRTITLNSKSEM